MPTDETTQNREVEGSVVYIIHADWDDGVEEFTRTAISLLTKDDLNLTVDEDEEELNLASQRRTRRYRTHNTATMEVSSPIDIDLEAASLMGIVDADDDGRLTFGTSNRRLRPEEGEFIEIAYFNEEDLDLTEAELIHRLADVEVANPEIDMSETPPIMGWEWIIHGDIWLDYDTDNDSDPTT